ncbi:MAG: hypothetical protein ACYDEV_00245 [Acidiferrobacter sp.]
MLAVAISEKSYRALAAARMWFTERIPFFDLIRDPQVVIATVAAKRSADANIAEKARTQKDIIRVP